MEKDSFISKISESVKSGFKRLKSFVKNNTFEAVGLLLAFITFVISIVFFCFLLKIAFIPTLYVVIIFISLIMISVICGQLQEWKVSGIIAKALCVILSVGMIIGCNYINTTIKTIDKVSGVRKQTSYMNVYVMNGNVANGIADTNHFSYGYLSGIDNENNEKVFEKINGIEYKKIEFNNVNELANALKNGDVQAIILNRVYLGLITSLDGLSNFDKEIKSIFDIKVETEVNIDDEEPTLPPLMSATPVPTGTSEPTPTHDPGVPTGSPTPTFSPTPTPTPYTGLAYTFGDLVVPKENYLYGNDNVFTCYISGIDTFGTPDVVSRSDVNILVTVNLNTHQIMMMNTPRDYYIPLSGANMRDKLTHAGCYGVSNSMRTLGSLYGINIDYYAKINFTGFIKVVDALGGIDIEVAKDFVSRDGYKYSQGLQHLDGTYALHYARERNAFAGGDNQRGKNQMQVITAIINKLTSTDALLHFNELFESISQCVVTNMSYDRIAELVRYQVETMSSWNITSHAVSGTNGWDLCYALGAANDVVIPNEDTVREARKIFRNVYNGLNP